MSATYAGNSQTPAHTENYAYDTNGYLTTVTIGGVVRAERVNDAAGRVVRYIERNENNSVRTDATRTWDADGLQTLETDNLTGRTTTYTYSGEGSLSTVVSEGGGSAKTTTSYTYEWWDSAKQKEVKAQGDNGQSGWAPGFSRFTYDVNGNVKSATDVVGKREFRYLVDGDGRVLRRDEYLGSETNAAGELVSARGNRSHSYYYLGGHRVGNVGNDGVERVDYAQELSRTTPEQTKAEDYYKRFKPSAGADFDENYMPINSGYPGSAPGAYTVRAGETLRSIATSLWGDAALWWVLADANGLSGDDALIAGTVLRVPNKVTNVHNTSETYRPYDPGKALGNTSPTLPEPPPPPGRGGCGGLGAVLSVVVAVAVTAWTGGAASALLGSKMLGWAAAGAMGSVAGQATAMATGVQDNFSWTGVALGAVGAGVTAGLTQAGSLSAALTKLGDTGSQIALGGIRSVVTQGIGVTTGLQSSFDWKGVAISAVAQGVSYFASNAIGEAQYGERDWAILNNGVGPELRNAFFARDGIETAVRSVGAGLAAGTSSALMRGGSLGAQLGAVTLDAVGASIGNAVAGQLASADLAGALKNVSASDLRTMQRLGERAGISSWEDPAKLQILAKASWAQGAQGHWYSPEERAGITASYLGLFSGMSEDRVNETMRLFRAEGLFSDLTTRMAPRNVVASTQGPDTTQEFSSTPTFYLPETSVVGQIPKPFLLARALDDMTVGAGRVVEQLGQAIESNPIAKAGLMALDVAAGPAAFAVRQAVSMTELGRIIERGQEQALGYLVGRFDLAGYEGAESGSGAIGTMALGSALLGGATRAIGDLSSLARTIRMDVPNTTGKNLLPTEGNVATFEELIAAGRKGDNVTPHHIPSAKHMAQYGIAKGDGVAINMEHPYPGVGGRHRNTFTYGNSADVNMTSRDALAAGIWDARRVYQQDGLYGIAIRQQLQELIRQNKLMYPDFFGRK